MNALVAVVSTAVLTAIPNPFDDVEPNVNFGPEFNDVWVRVLGGVWGLILILIGVFIAMSWGEMARAAASQNPAAHADSKKTVILGLCAFAGAIAIPAILAGIIFMLGR